MPAIPVLFAGSLKNAPTPGGDRHYIDRMDRLRVYFHPRSPYSRLGLHVVQKAGLQARTELSVHAFTRPAGGAPFFNPTDSKPKFRYIMEDAPRMTLRAGLPIAPPLRPEPDYTNALTAFYAAREAGFGLAFAIALSDARWGESKDISDPECLRGCADQAGVPNGVDLQASPPDAADTDAAWIDQDNVFGVPFAALETGGQTHHFWGQDRFELIAEMASA